MFALIQLVGYRLINLGGIQEIFVVVSGNCNV